jgi:hypothetical protein
MKAPKLFRLYANNIFSERLQDFSDRVDIVESLGIEPDFKGKIVIEFDWNTRYVSDVKTVPAAEK